MDGDSQQPLTLKVINALYVEAMVLADEARAYFDEHSHGARERMAPLARVTFSCESLKVTARLMHVIAWLLTRRAMAEGGCAAGSERGGDRLGTAAESDPDGLAALPIEARQLIESSMGLYRRVARLETGLARPRQDQSPARRLQARLMANIG